MHLSWAAGDFLPVVGRHPRLENCYLNVGYAGHELEWGWAGGKQVSILATGGPPAEEPLLSARRFK